MSTAHKTIKTVLATFVGAFSVFAFAFAGQAFAQTATDTSSTTSGTLSASTSSSSGPVFGPITVTNLDSQGGTATVTWTSDTPATSQVFYGLNAGEYSGSTTIDNALVTNHTATITGLSPNTTYHFGVSSNDGNGVNGFSGDQVFTMPALSQPIATSTGTTSTSTEGMTTDELSALVSQLQAELSALQSQLNALVVRVQSLQSGSVSSSGTGTTTTTTGGISSSNSTSGSGIATIEPQNTSVRTGTSVDFTGHGFWNNESVKVMNNGQTVATAQADGGGNFSTGSLPVSMAPGASQTYTFIGSWSGITGQATVNVTQ